MTNDAVNLPFNQVRILLPRLDYKIDKCLEEAIYTTVWTDIKIIRSNKWQFHIVYSKIEIPLNKQTKASNNLY